MKKMVFVAIALITTAVHAGGSPYAYPFLKALEGEYTNTVDCSVREDGTEKSYSNISIEVGSPDYSEEIKERINVIVSFPADERPYERVLGIGYDDGSEKLKVTANRLTNRFNRSHTWSASGTWGNLFGTQVHDSQSEKLNIERDARGLKSLSFRSKTSRNGLTRSQTAIDCQRK
jgi:hypothetical protein